MANKAEHKSIAELRSDAEKRLARLEDMSFGAGGEDVQKLVHELRVHQIELEMQNAQLTMTQAELEKSREKYTDLFDFAPVGYVSLDENGLVLEANLTIATLLGTERRRIVQGPFQVNVALADRDLFRDHLQKVSKTKARDRCELQLKTRTGSEFYAQLDSLYIEEDGKISYRTAITDITERRLATAALLENRAKLEAALASMTDAVFISDAEGVFVNVNEAFVTFLKFKNKDEYFKTFAEYPDVFELFIAGKPAPPEMWPVKRALSGETAINAEYTLRRKDTGETWIGSHSFSPIRDKNGVIVGSVVTARDITERKQTEEALRKSHDELELRVRERTAELNSYMAKLEQSNQDLQDFASIASHDMREPLRKVISFGNMLKQQAGDSLGQSGNDYLNRMLHATERMQSLLTGLFDYSRVATTSEPFKEVDLSDLIGGVLSDLEVRIIRTGGKVHVEKLPVLSADPTQMRQLFQNLIGNSLKFHKRGEKPMVQVRSLSNNNSGCQIIVEDNGIGFEEHYLDRIFAPFQRLHGRSEYEGTGMGLAICKKIVERHGGSITARSTPGLGTTFIVTLPLKRP